MIRREITLNCVFDSLLSFRITYRFENISIRKMVDARKEGVFTRAFVDIANQKCSRFSHNRISIECGEAASAEKYFLRLSRLTLLIHSFSFGRAFGRRLMYLPMCRMKYPLNE